MGYDLTNAAGDDHQWRSIGWWHLLNLAVHYGWTPAGTLPGPDVVAAGEKWDGNYFHTAGQRVAAADAAGLASALQGLLADVDREAVAAEVAGRLAALMDEASTDEPGDPLDLATFPVKQFRSLSGGHGIGVLAFDVKGCAYLDQFIAFCRRGNFVIE